ncbi:UNVERIFIED_CONTAM: hypothetical protein RMT77_014755 [Armadillidium vulgare]
MFDKEKSHHFIKLCTGEYGPTYKGTSFRKGDDDDDDDTQSILEVEDFIENGSQSKRVIDYNFCDEEIDVYDCKKGQFFLYIPDKVIGFEIFLTTKDFCGTNEIVGKVVSPTNLKNCINYEHSSFLKILDCGIILEV